MAQYSCIAIGINQYQFLQPLNYAEADAYELQQFLTQQTNLSGRQCLLFSDASPSIGQQSTYPTKANLLRWLEEDRSESHPFATSILWFFFSGYGVSWQDEDYIMPVDADPNNIPGTAISLRSLFTALKNQGADNVLVLMDMNRSPGIFADTAVGAQAARLAAEMGIALVLSTQAEEFSHESATLNHGLFTEALLEALNYYHRDLTLGELDQYLKYRLPQLSEHHWRPPQTPLTVIPSHQALQQLILPETDSLLVDWQGEDKVSFGNNNHHGTSQPKLESYYSQNGHGAGTLPATGVMESKPPAREENNGHLPAKEEKKKQPESSSALVVSPTQEEDSSFWSNLIFWGGTASLALALVASAIMIMNRDRFEPQPSLEEGEPGSNSGGDDPAVPLNPSPGATTVENIAPPEGTNAPESSNNQVVLNRARTYIQSPGQASGFSRAINEARKIKQGEPLYSQAQADILRWSQVIWDIAQGRASQGNFDGAVAAAKLVPQDAPPVYTQAQAAIKEWGGTQQQRQQNQLLIQAAKEQVRPYQASSYNQAIATLRLISPGQPGYEQAQELIEEWSRQIYLIANSRAARGEFQQAINTAVLVPKDTSTHALTQQAIARWRGGQR